MKTRLACLAVALWTVLSVPPGFADDADDLRRLHDTTIRLINALVSQGVLARDKADAIIREADADAAHARAAGPENAAPSAPAPAPAAPSAAELTQLLVEQGVITQEQADALAAKAAERAAAQAAQARAAAAAAAAAAPRAAPAAAASAGRAVAGSLPAAAGSAAPKGVVRVPYVPEIVRQQITEEVKRDVLAQAHEERWGEPGALPDWIRRIQWAGEFRLRSEIDFFPTDTSPNASVATFQGTAPYFYPINDTTSTRDRFFIRARLGMTSLISDWVSAGLRISTGGTGTGANVASENDALGGYDSRLAIGLDRAYVALTPRPWALGMIGRFKNPFYEATTLIWSDSIHLEGLYLKFTPALLPTLDGLFIAGAFPIQTQDNEVISAGASGHSKWLFAYQAGVHWFVRPDQDLRVAAAFYDFHRIEGVAAPDVNNLSQNDWSIAAYRQKGNQTFDVHVVGDLNTFPTGVPGTVGLISKFREVNLTASYDVGSFAPTHVIIDGDFVRNIGFHQGDILVRTLGLLGVQDKADTLRGRVTGYQAMVTVGRPRLVDPWDWQMFGGYRYVERDAVVDAFTDADFRTGGTNAKGYIVGGRFNFAKNTGLMARWMSGREVDGPLPLSIDLIQVDLQTSF